MTNYQLDVDWSIEQQEMFLSLSVGSCHREINLWILQLSAVHCPCLFWFMSAKIPLTTPLPRSVLTHKQKNTLGKIAIVFTWDAQSHMHYCELHLNKFGIISGTNVLTDLPRLIWIWIPQINKESIFILISTFDWHKSKMSLPSMTEFGRILIFAWTQFPGLGVCSSATYSLLPRKHHHNEYNP